MILNMFERPSIYMGIIVLSWGIIMTLTGIVQNFGGLCAVRVLLGLFEYVVSFPIPLTESAY